MDRGHTQVHENVVPSQLVLVGVGIGIGIGVGL